MYVPPEDPYIVQVILRGHKYRGQFFSVLVNFLLQGSEIEVTEDREAVLDCVSPGGKPAADVGDFLYNQNKQKITEKEFGK